MTTRDRLVLMTIVVLGVLAAGWMLGVSPERKKAAKLDAEVSTAQATLATAQGQLAEARGAQAQYATAYASVVKLGKAVPAEEQVPSLVYELDQATHQKDVEFNSIAVGSGSGGSTASASATALGAAASGGFTQMPFTFIFRGTFADLYHLLNQVDAFTLNTTSGVQVTGRLLTIQSASLELKQEGAGEEASSSKKGKGSSSSAKEEQLIGTITATAYVLPPGEGLTGGATASGPAGTSATPASGSSPSSSTPSSSSTAPAVVKVTP
jgi:type II secretory pathway pseudopilin PulG